MSSKTRIETVAQETVQRSGLKSLSFRTLGAEVGVKSSSVHYHFPEKSDLAHALIERYRNSLSTVLSEISENSASSHASITEFCQTFIQECSDNKMCFAGMLAAEVEFLNETNRASLNKLFEDLHTWIAHEFSKADDELKVDLPAAVLARVLMAALEGGLLIDRSQSSDQHLSAVTVLVDNWFGKVN